MHRCAPLFADQTGRPVQKLGLRAAAWNVGTGENHSEITSVIPRTQRMWRRLATMWRPVDATFCQTFGMPASYRAAPLQPERLLVQ